MWVRLVQSYFTRLENARQDDFLHLLPMAVGPSVTLLRLLLRPNWLAGIFYHYPCPPAHDLGSRVSGLLSNESLNVFFSIPCNLSTRLLRYSVISVIAKTVVPQFGLLYWIAIIYMVMLVIARAILWLKLYCYLLSISFLISQSPPKYFFCLFFCICFEVYRPRILMILFLNIVNEKNSRNNRIRFNNTRI